MSVHKITSRYAKSIIELAQEQGVLEEVIENAKLFKEVAKNRDFLSLLRNPVYKPVTKLKVFSALFQNKVNKIFYRFIELVVRKNRENLLPLIMDEILIQYKSMQKITDIELTTASEMPDEFITELKNVLKKTSLIDENMEINTHIDKSILGGFIIRIGDKLIDSSAKSKLKAIEKNIIETKYIRVI
ncbi:MAG TPA: ATP synthase F1 subunit delta [Bacteroidetes bacterium]|nr:ATP synthase F1 subunit delta [Bacteroidota bacterium]